MDIPISTRSFVRRTVHWANALLQNLNITKAVWYTAQGIDRSNASKSIVPTTEVFPAEDKFLVIGLLGDVSFFLLGCTYRARTALNRLLGDADPSNTGTKSSRTSIPFRPYSKHGQHRPAAYLICRASSAPRLDHFKV